MSLDLISLFVLMSFLAIPTISFLLPSTGQVLVQIGMLFAAQAVILFLVVNPLFGAVVWMIYVGAVCVLFLVAVAALTPNQWRTKQTTKGTYPLVATLLVTFSIGGFICFNELNWLINSLNTYPSYISALASHRLAPNSYLDVNNLLLQNIGFTENATMYLTCAVLLLVGMLVVIQVTIAPKTVNTFIKKKVNKVK